MPEFVRGVLLQGARGERRGRVRLCDALFDILDDIGIAFERRDDRRGLLRLGRFVLFAVLFRQKRFERRIALGLILQFRGDVPVFLGHERGDLALSVHDEPERHRLYAARGKPRLDALTQKRRKFVANKAVQHPARLLGVHEVIVDVARILQRAVDRCGRDLVELDAVIFAVFEF